MYLGKRKILTFSFDDGITQDIRLIKLFNKYGMKATFNINSELLGKDGELFLEGVAISHVKNKPQDIKSIYVGHEVAVHTLTHPNLQRVLDDAEVVRQVEQDRINLSDLCGYEVVGMAYPCGGFCYDQRVIDLIRRNTGVKYARAASFSGNFEFPTELLEIYPSVGCHLDKMFELGEKFLKLEADSPQIFYVCGHSFEFDIHNEWARFEDFLQMMSGRSDIRYCTNKEAFL